MKQIENSGKNIEYLNTAKGIGIILVVVGHALPMRLVENYRLLYLLRILIYAVHMPLFFIISGYLFELKKYNYYEDKIKVFFKKKFIRFIIPYLTFSIAIYMLIYITKYVPKIYKLFYKFGFEVGSINKSIYSILTYEQHIDKHLWFCYVMFIILILEYAINRYLSDKRLIISNIIILYIFYIITSILTFPELIWKTSKYLFIFNLGCRIKYIEYFSSSQIGRRISIIISVISYVLFTFTKYNGLYLANLAISPIFEMFSVIVVLIISKKIVETKSNLAFSYLGKKSYVIYLFHQPFIVSGITGILSLLFTTKIQIMFIPIVSIIGIIIPLIVDKVIILKSDVCKFLFLGEKNK